MATNKISKNVIMLVVVLVIILVIIGFFKYLNSGEKAKITTNGKSEIKTAPEFVSVYIMVETLNDSAQIAKDENAKISENVLIALLKTGLEKKDIETVSYNIYENYIWDGQKQKKEGFKVSNNLKIKVKNIDLTGKVVDVVIDNKALVQGINFEISLETENKLKKETLAKAAQDAREKAEALAEGSGGKLGKLVGLNDNEFYYQPYPIYAYTESTGGAVDAKRAATNIQPQELTVTGNVNAVYEIK